MIRNLQKYSKNIIIILYLLVISFAVLYFSTSSSPRYAINPWYDSNAFFTVGKAMANGIIPYKDIFEQKGPLLYLIHSLGYMISENSFFGVYIFEALSFFITSVFIYKISRLYISPTFSIAVSNFSLITIVCSPCFYYGDSAEEFCLPFMTVGLYYLLKFFKSVSDKELSKHTYWICGFCAGCIAMIKFTVIGFWFGWMAVIALYTVFIQKKIFKAFVNSLIFISGMISAFIPWVIYFALNNGLKDFINVYFVVNATAYADYKNVHFGIKIWLSEFLYKYFHNFSVSPFFAVCSICGAVSPLIFSLLSEKKVTSKIAVPLVFVSTVFFTYVGGTSFQYYFTAFSVFIPLAFITVFLLINKIRINKIISTFIILIVSVSVVYTASTMSVSSKYTTRNIKDTFQYSFSQDIKNNSLENSVISYNKLDTGIYVFDNIIPNVKFFETQNIPYEKFPDNIDEQNNYINTHSVNYVITDIAESEKNNPLVTPKLFSDYSVVNKKTDFVYSTASRKLIPMTYYLYKLK